MKTLRKIRQWVDDRACLTKTLAPLGSHLTPPGSKWWYVFGSATLFAFLLQVVTGIALATVYVPSAGQAYNSLTYISTLAPFGALLRGMHYFGASAMVLFVGIHMIRVFLTGSFKFPRELNWVSGVVLLGLTLAMGFTGQLLRWDQNAVWSAVVGAAQAARTPFVGPWLVPVVFSGTTIGTATLSHFFTLHVFVVPVLLAGVIGFHLFLVLRNGISEPPVAGQPVDPATCRGQYDALLERTGHPFWPYAAWRDAVFGAAVLVGIVVLAFVFGAPHLGQPPDPSIVKAEPRPDWYLLWYFAVLALLPHGVESVVIIGAPLAGALLLLAVPFISNRGERHWRRRPWAPAIILFIVTCVGVLWHAGVRAAWSPDFSATPVPAPAVNVSSGPALEGLAVFNKRGCLFCHTILEHGGTRGPALTYIGDELTRSQMVIRILNGGYNMPGYANNIAPQELNAVVDFLAARKRTAADF
jgi:ubiquinol-cytochrome c reductase cytochrome b subunit